MAASGEKSDKAMAAAVVVLPPLVFSAKVLFGGGGWMAATLFFILGPAWLVWYAVLVVVSRALRAREGVFAPDGGLGGRLVRGSIAAQLGFFALLCLLLPDFTDVGQTPSVLGRLLGLSGDEETRSLAPVTGTVALAAVPGVLVSFVLMIATMSAIWFRRAGRGPRGRTLGA